MLLRAVLESGSINAAARTLAYSPATVSQHLSALARETGLVLFEKQGRGIVATAAAHQLAEHAGPLLADFGRLERVLADLRDGQAERLAIACMASAAERWMPGVVRAVRRHRPHLTVEISLNEPVDGRGRRRPDLNVRTESTDGVAMHLPGYRRHELAVEDLVAVLPADHPLAAAPSVALSSLAGEPWVDHDIYDSPIGQIVLGACRTAGFTPRYAARLDDHRSALRMVAAGIGITILPLLAVTPPSADLAIRPLTHPAVSRRIVAHALQGPGASPLIPLAVDHLRRAAAPRTDRDPTATGTG